MADKVYDPVFQQWVEPLPEPEPEPEPQPESIEDWARGILLRHRVNRQNRPLLTTGRRYDMVFGQWVEQFPEPEPPAPVDPFVSDPVFDWASRRLELLTGQPRPRIYVRYNENHDEAGRFAESDSSGGSSGGGSSKDSGGTKTISVKAYDEARRNGGVTIDLEGNQPTEGYAYAPNKDTETPVPLSEFTPEDIDNFIDQNFDELSQEGNHLGLWASDEDMYIDISRVGPPSAATIEKAQGAQQLAVFDLKTFTEVPTGKMGSKGYEPAGKASDIHNQHQGKDKGPVESRGAGGTSEVPRGTEESEVSRLYSILDWARQRIELRYNENHDEAGRFSESDSSGGGSDSQSGSGASGSGKGGIPHSKEAADKYPPGMQIMSDHPSITGKTPGKLTDEDINTMADTLAARYEACDQATRDAGAAWYPDASDLLNDIANENGYTPEQAYGVAASLSPLTKWEPDNVRLAVEFMSKYGDSPNANPDLEIHGIGPAGNANLERAMLASKSDNPRELLGGSKISSFYDNFNGDTHSVTVDTWAAKAAANADTRTSKNLIAGKGYEKVAESYRRGAEKAGVSAPAFQATVWLHISGNRI